MLVIMLSLAFNVTLIFDWLDQRERFCSTPKTTSCVYNKRKWRTGRKVSSYAALYIYSFIHCKPFTCCKGEGLFSHLKVYRFYTWNPCFISIEITNQDLYSWSTKLSSNSFVKIKLWFCSQVSALGYHSKIKTNNWHKNFQLVKILTKNCLLLMFLLICNSVMLRYHCYQSIKYW